MKKLILCLVSAMLLLSSAVVRAEIPDVRVLIDISGSMKHTDPENLRAPALRLLTSLLPEDAQAGVWTFGKQVNMLVPHGPTAGTWKQQALNGSRKITSVALFTDLEVALQTATRSWQTSAARGPRHLVLLTDGMVDVSRDSAESAASRERILQEFLPMASKSAMSIHTVALSDKADHELLKTLSEATNGWYEKADAAEQLQRSFLHLFEKATPPEALPISANNTFVVDANVEEVTLVVFSNPDKATTLEAPSGASVDASADYPTLHWHQEKGFDLITIQRPSEGEWKIHADFDPDNRALILTDLKLEVDAIPNHIVPGEAFALGARFTDQHTTISRPAFLDVVGIELQQFDAAGDVTVLDMTDNGQGQDEQARDGVFTVLAGENLEAGTYELVVQGHSSTFQRQHRQKIEVVGSLFETELATAATANLQGHVMHVSSRPGLVDPETVVMEVTALDSTGATHTLEAVAAEPHAWEIAIPDELGVGSLSVTVKVNGTNVRGWPLEQQLAPVEVARANPVVEAPAEPVPVAEPEPVATPEPVASVAEPVAAPAEPASDLVGIILIGVLNVLFLLGGGFAFWMWRKGNKNTDFGLSEGAAA